MILFTINIILSIKWSKCIPSTLFHFQCFCTRFKNFLLQVRSIVKEVLDKQIERACDPKEPNSKSLNFLNHVQEQASVWLLFGRKGWHHFIYNVYHFDLKSLKDLDTILDENFINMCKMVYLCILNDSS